MRAITAALCLALGLASMARAANSDSPVAAGVPSVGADFVVGISPFLQSAEKDAVYRSLVRLIVEDIPLNSRLDVYDAYNLKSVTRVSIPNAKVFNSPKTRANQFALAIGDIKRFLARENGKPTGPKAGFDGAIRLPQFCDFLAQDHAPHDDIGKLSLLLIGSPLYQDANEPAFSMVDGYFPSDGHLRASREQSVFGFNSGEDSSQGLQVYWSYFGEPWTSDLHREKSRALLGALH